MNNWQKELDRWLTAAPDWEVWYVTEKDWWHRLDDADRENYAAARCDCGSNVGLIPCPLEYEVADSVDPYFTPFWALSEEYEVRCEACQLKLDAEDVAWERMQEREYRLYLWTENRAEYHYQFGPDATEEEV